MRRVWAVLAGAVMAAAAGGIACVPAGAAVGPGAAAAAPGPVPLAIPLGAVPGVKPPTIAQCKASQGIPCYGPPQLQAAYGMAPLYKAGHEGKGKTIAIVDAYGSPAIKTDLAGFDKGYNLPAPPSLKIITPEGKPTSGNSGWALETTLDVEWAHAMAPQANILLVVTPVNETIGTAGFPQIVKAEEYVISHKLGDVISQSFAAAEQTFPSHKSLLGLRGAYTWPPRTTSLSWQARETGDPAAPRTWPGPPTSPSGWPTGLPLTRWSPGSAARSCTSTRQARGPPRTTCGMTPRCSAAQPQAAAASPRCSLGLVSSHRSRPWWALTAVFPMCR